MAAMVHKKRRLYALDFIVLAAVAGLVGYVAYRVDTVLIYKWDWSAIPSYLFRWDDETATLVPNLLIKGLVTTIRISIWAMVVASIMGVVLGMARTSNRLFFRLVSWAYVGLIRNIPPVPFLFLFYFFISSQIMPLLGIDAAIRNASPETLAIAEVFFGPANLMSNFVSGLISLSMLSAAYIAEIVRAGIQAVPAGQREAGQTVGLSRFSIMRYIILPQAIERVVPPLAGQFISLIKDSSLVALISIQELTFLAMEIAISEQRFFEVWIFTGFMYFVVCYACALAFGWLEQRMGAHRR